MTDDHITAIISIGHIAWKTLNTNKEAAVLGITSKGVFAATPDKNILYFSGEEFRGPLTVNLLNFSQIKSEISIQAFLKLYPNKIRFRQTQVDIDIDRLAFIWEPPAFSSVIPPKSLLLKRADKLSEWMDYDTFIEALNISHNIFNDLQEYFRKGEYQHIIDFLVSLLGRGTGLTPTGDDFICGFLLAAYYWHEHIIPDFPIEQIRSRLSQDAAQLTTTLSKNLIDCAVQGSADERILQLLHWLNDGNGNLNTIAKELRSYGSSSGFDTLHGMLSFIRYALISQS